ncbi:MAG: YaiI/YqxD family protein [Bacillota bacterium]
MRRIKILVDGDGCPVVKITEDIAEKFGCKLIIFTNYAHQVDSDYGQVKKLDIESQSVDMEIVNRVEAGDIVITQDYGLAALVLGKGAAVINNSGNRYTEENIDQLLAKRHFYAKMRRANQRHPTHSKRTSEEDNNFRKSLIRLLERRY